MQRIMSLLAAEIAFWLRLARMGTREHVMAQRVSLPTLPTAELLPSGHATIEAIADRLAMSKRTLQRRLGDEGQSFRQQLDRTHEQLARHYLKQPGLSTSEIAFLLGFEDPNSFHCAFQGWTGTTPSTLRGNRKIYLFGIIQPLSMTPR